MDYNKAILEELQSIGKKMDKIAIKLSHIDCGIDNMNEAIDLLHDTGLIFRKKKEDGVVLDDTIDTNSKNTRKG